MSSVNNTQTFTETTVDTTVETTQPETTSAELFAICVENNTKMLNLAKEQQKVLKSLESQIKKEAKKKNKSVKKSIKQVPKKVSPEMQKFISKNFKDKASNESMYTRHELMRFVSDYIKSQNIQNPENMKEWSGKEKTLKKLFNLTEEWYKFIDVNGMISKVITK